MQTERSGTMGTGNDKTIFCLATQQGGAELRTDDGAPTLTAAAGMSGNNQPVIAIPINDKATRWQGGGESRNHDGSGNGLGVGKEGDPSPTLTAGDRHGVMCMTPWDAQSQRVYDEKGVMASLSARENSGLNRESVLCAGFKLGNSKQARSSGYEEEKSPTLNAGCGGNKPAVACLNDQGGSVMYVTEDVTGTLRAQEHGHQPVCLDMTRACDVVRDCGDIVPCLQARMGTGGNQVPLTYGIGNGQAHEGAAMTEEVSQTLNTMHDAQAVMYEDVAHALRAKANFAYREDTETYPVQNMVVRRLTPLECNRLQGFPDGWVDIGDWVDEQGKKHKEADSPKYKALGNSIALPFWQWMIDRMAKYLPENATLGSLFDGIGGFPLCFERTHGKGSARWASEIEPFPIAVTKKWFWEG